GRRPVDILGSPGGHTVAAGRDPVLDRATSQWLRRPARPRQPHARDRAAGGRHAGSADQRPPPVGTGHRRTGGTLRRVVRRRAWTRRWVAVGLRPAPAARYLAPIQRPWNPARCPCTQSGRPRHAPALACWTPTP